MRWALVPVTAILMSSFAAPLGAAESGGQIIFRRGDANRDGKVDVSDVSYISAYVYQGGPAPPCLDAADANDDGQVNGADADFLADYLFNGGPTPPWPGPGTCGPDATEDNLGCNIAC